MGEECNNHTNNWNTKTINFLIVFYIDNCIAIFNRNFESEGQVDWHVIAVYAFWSYKAIGECRADSDRFTAALP